MGFGISSPRVARHTTGRHRAFRKRSMRIGGGSSDDLLPPSPPAEKATARQDQTRKSSTDHRAGNGSYRCRERRITGSGQNERAARSSEDPEVGPIAVFRV